MSTANEAAVREQAYYFWEQDGRPDGRESEYWQRAVAALGDAATPKVARKRSAKSVAEAPPKRKAAASSAKAAPAKSAKAASKATKGDAAKKPKKK